MEAGSQEGRLYSCSLFCKVGPSLSDGVLCSWARTYYHQAPGAKPGWGEDE